MIFILPLVFALAAAQQPSAPQPPAAQPHTARDTTVNVISEVGVAVADVRADLDHYRTMVFNDSEATGRLLEAGRALQGACARLSHAATTGHRVMCIRCLVASLRQAFTRYRDNLPSVASLGSRCAARIRTTHLETAKPAALRRLALDLTTMTRSPLGVYEQRLSGVLAAMRGPAQRRAPPPAGPGSP